MSGWSACVCDLTVLMVIILEAFDKTEIIDLMGIVDGNRIMVPAVVEGWICRYCTP